MKKFSQMAKVSSKTTQTQAPILNQAKRAEEAFYLHISLQTIFRLKKGKLVVLMKMGSELQCLWIEKILNFLKVFLKLLIS